MANVDKKNKNADLLLPNLCSFLFLCQARGNALYKAHKFLAAVDAYSEAIDLAPRVKEFYGNRAAAELMRKNYAKVSDAGGRLLGWLIGSSRMCVVAAACLYLRSSRTVSRRWR